MINKKNIINLKFIFNNIIINVRGVSDNGNHGYLHWLNKSSNLFASN